MLRHVVTQIEGQQALVKRVAALIAEMAKLTQELGSAEDDRCGLQLDVSRLEIMGEQAARWQRDEKECQTEEAPAPLDLGKRRVSAEPADDAKMVEDYFDYKEPEAQPDQVMVPEESAVEDL